MNPLKLFVTGHKGFETLLFHEIRRILESGEAQITRRYGGVEVVGDIQDVYLLCLHSRLANRVFCQLKEFKADDETQLYDAVSTIDWSDHFTTDDSFAISATLSRSNMDHSHYVSLKVKDAIVDQFRARFDSRPSIQKQQPDIHIHINIHRNQAKLSLDLSGESLHKRGYRIEHAGAPLKEHLAASMLAHAGWTRETANSHRLIDPMCGSGTFAIEAAMIAADIAPGLDRNYFGFEHWLAHDSDLWQRCLSEAEAKIDTELKPEILASDYDAAAIKVAIANAERAGVGDLIRFDHEDISELSIPATEKPTIIICNPPYGERLQSEQGLASLYSEMGNSLRRITPATLHIISANPDLLHRLRMRRTFKKAIRNGPIDCLLGSFDIVASAPSDQPPEPKPVASATSSPAADQSKPRELKGHEIESMTPLLNRLQKNNRHWTRWAKRNHVSCYRLYDADLPDFSFALDAYQSEITPSICWYHLQEYQAPKIIDADKAESRIELAREAVKQVFNIDDRQLFCKIKKRQRGTTQYQKQDSQGELFQVREGAASLLVNLSDYLDSGLFLDHRIMRQRVYDLSRGKSLLNLFCYTGSVGVQAGLGGARQVVNADMSATYLKWAQENHAINQLDDSDRYQFVRADVVELLANPKRFDLEQKFDLIFLDPPSFSNSSKMLETLDIQRDHQSLISNSMQLLELDGLLLFSTNRKGFKLDEAISADYLVKDISRETVPEDFRRRPGIHKCWEIRHKRTDKS